MRYVCSTEEERPTIRPMAGHRCGPVRVLVAEEGYVCVECTKPLFHLTMPCLWYNEVPVAVGATGLHLFPHPPCRFQLPDAPAPPREMDREPVRHPGDAPRPAPPPGMRGPALGYDVGAAPPHQGPARRRTPPASPTPPSTPPTVSPPASGSERDTPPTSESEWAGYDSSPTRRRRRSRRPSSDDDPPRRRRRLSPGSSSGRGSPSYSPTPLWYSPPRQCNCDQHRPPGRDQEVPTTITLD